MGLCFCGIFHLLVRWARLLQLDTVDDPIRDLLCLFAPVLCQHGEAKSGALRLSVLPDLTSHFRCVPLLRHLFREWSGYHMRRPKELADIYTDHSRHYAMPPPNHSLHPHVPQTHQKKLRKCPARSQSEVRINAGGRPEESLRLPDENSRHFLRRDDLPRLDHVPWRPGRPPKLGHSVLRS